MKSARAEKSGTCPRDAVAGIHITPVARGTDGDGVAWMDVTVNRGTERTIDHLTGGNFILGVGLGYREQEFQAFGVEKRSRVPRFRAYIEVMRLLWSQDRAS